MVYQPAIALPRGDIVPKNYPRLVVLTGVTKGLGQAMAQKFIELGHTVLGCGRSRELIENLRRTHRPPHDFAAVDVSQENLVEPWAARLLSTHGAPDLLITTPPSSTRPPRCG